jgi:hypothetical protein
VKSELVRKESAKRQHKKQKRQKIQEERLAYEQQRLNSSWAVSRWDMTASRKHKRRKDS